MKNQRYTPEFKDDPIEFVHSLVDYAKHSNHSWIPSITDTSCERENVLCDAQCTRISLRVLGKERRRFL
ncbi:MAG: hypothetical protein ACI9UU_002201 [Candidatus Azotimanducaceae bacterium]|jgi:hypothetical protein